MKIKFTKADGTGNDFIIIYDNYSKIKNPDFIKKICSKKTGVGVDGMLLISDHNQYDYKLDYFNNDGSWETLCANGARCAALFMYTHKYCNKKINFLAGDGPHKIKIEDKENISLSMAAPLFKTEKITSNNYTGQYVNSGAKHFVTEVDHINNEDVKKYGRKIRNDKIFSPNGLNVNFIKIINSNHIYVKTYEKGIENMVLSCGSGSVAAAYYAHQYNKIKSPIKISVEGGELTLTFNQNWSDVWLSGPAKLLFEKTVEL